MENEHSPTPWSKRFVLSGTEIRDAHRGYVGNTVSGIDTELRDRANATRIVFCVNACEGISSGQLTRGELKLVLRKLAEVSNECDELLEALKMADCLLRGANMNRDAVELKVRAAIAKAESRREEP